MIKTVTLRWTRLVTIVIVAIWIGVGLALWGVSSEQPSCPTEDSCTADYRDGRWHIERTTNR